MTPAERQARARAWAVAGRTLRTVTVSGDRVAVQSRAEGGTGGDVRARRDAGDGLGARRRGPAGGCGRELAAMAARVDRIGQALEVE